MRLLAGLAAACVALPAAAQEPPRLSLPLDCDFARVCSVQNYVDLDPGPGFADPTCGPLGYDGDRGTDLRVPTRAHLRAGVPVLAAAEGVVRAARDGEPDRRGDDARVPAEGGAAGNAVALDHGGGWETQYNHLRRGSVTVYPGQRVRRGQVLGLLGQSGRAAFPHLEFALRRDGTAIDPFTGRPAGGGCGPGGAGLWTPQAAAALTYRAGGLLAAGIALGRPELAAALDGAYTGLRIGPGAPALVAWAAAWGLRAGDRERLVLRGPGGELVAQRETRIARDQARWFAFTGARRPPAGWPSGTYRLRYRVLRGDAPVVEREERFEIR